MLSPSSILNSKNEQALTPLTCLRNDLRPPSRKLWQKGNVTPNTCSDKWSRFQAAETEKWDVINSPQFVDFSNFLDRNIMTASTPKPDYQNYKLPNVAGNEDTLISSMNNFSLSTIKCETPDVTYLDSTYTNEENTVQYVVHSASIKAEKNIKEEVCNKVKKPQGIITSPFNFNSRDKFKQKPVEPQKPDENEKRIFRANPIPKFIKTRFGFISNNNNNKNSNNENLESDMNEQGCSSGTQVKKNTEVWKKRPFIPCLPKRNLQKPKTPSLSTAARAEERKRFDEALKEKEMRKEELKRMEIAAKKKQEEEEILKLRKQLVHKAQPIRKYKNDLPQVLKRPLTDPISPLLLKRRRRG